MLPRAETAADGKLDASMRGRAAKAGGVSTRGEEHRVQVPDDIDTLLAELLPQDVGPGELTSPHRTHGPGTAVHPDETADEDRPEASPGSKRRVGIVALAAATLAVAAVAGIGGYWFGATRPVEMAEPAAGETTVTTGPVVPPSSTVVQGSDPEPEGTAEALESQLNEVDLSLVTFSRGSDRLTGQGRAVVAEVAKLLVAHSSIPVKVKTSTYTEATPGQNHGLSMLQAESIADALIADGVEPTRLVAVGLGGHSRRPGDGGSLLLFDTDDPGLSEDLAQIDRTALALDAGDQLTSEVRLNLDRVADALSRDPEPVVTLLGYASAGSPEASHDRSHTVVDKAVAYLEGIGVARDRLATVGLGDAPIDVDRGTDVEIDVGAPAAASLAISQVDNGLMGFESGTDTLTPESMAILAEVAAALALDAKGQLEISVHTYSEATSQKNHDLSHRQGDAVAATLIAAGVERDRLVVTGHGDPPEFARSGTDSYVTFSVVG